jgi:hypothetical protein
MSYLYGKYEIDLWRIIAHVNRVGSSSQSARAFHSLFTNFGTITQQGIFSYIKKDAGKIAPIKGE